MTGNYRATVEYDGTDYFGFQVQPDRRTIQGELERALERVAQHSVRVTGAGRTDAGAHARGQVISFRVGWSHGHSALARAMNAVLPREIAVRDLAMVGERFHARFSAQSRAYVYSIHNGPVRAPLLSRYSHRVARPLDVEAMAQATSLLVGEHDFAACGQPPVGERTVRVVERAEWRSGPVGFDGCSGSEGHRLLRFVVEANAFLRGMVRRLVGTLLLVGVGSLSVDGFSEIIESADIGRAAPPAPASGLCLWRVRYDVDDDWDGQCGQVGSPAGP